MSNANVATRVTLLSQFPGEEFVEFGTEYTVSDELAFLANLSAHFVVDCQT